MRLRRKERKYGLQLFLLISVTVFALILSSCTQPETGNGDDKYSGTIRVAHGYYPPTLDPIVGWNTETISILNHVTEQLVVYDEEWNVIPQLAEDYFSSDNYTEWTFELREGVLFHNGEEMTAEDVEASTKRFLETSPRAYDLDGLVGMEISDPYTIKFIFDKPTPLAPVQFAYSMGGVHIMPKSILDTVEGPMVPPEKVVGTGPYVLEEAIPDQHIKLTRFEEYEPDTRYEDRTGFGGRKIAYAKEILFIPVPDASSRTAGTLAGDYDFAQDIPKSDYETVLDAPDVEPTINPATWLLYAYFRNVDGAIFSDLNMRRAVQVALDMDEIMMASAQREEFYRVDPSILFKETVWHYPAGEKDGLYNAADPELAKSYLDKAGYNGEEISFLASGSDYDYLNRAAIVITDQLQEAGLNVKLNVYDWATLASLRDNTDDWDIFLSSEGMSHDPSYLNYWHTNQDWLGYSNAKIDALIDEGMKYSTYEDRYPIYCELQETMFEEVTCVPLGVIAELSAINSNLEGFENYKVLRFYNVWKD